MNDENKNFGYGRGKVDGLMANVNPLGRIFVVGATTLANYVAAQRLFTADKNGLFRLYATLASAVAVCTASAGDVIYILPGHTESISSSTALTLSKAGVTIIGLGNGSLRPTFTLDTANTARINVSAANILVRNCIFVANFLNVATCFVLTTGAEFQVDNCEFRDTDSTHNFLCIVTTSATDNQADGLKFTNNYVYGLAATDGAVISILAATLRLVVNDNIVDKAATNDAGHMITLSSKIVGGVRILRNILTVVGSSGAAVGIFLTGSGSTSSGVIGFNNVWSLDTTGGLFMTASTGIRPMQNYLSGAVDKSGTLTPTADDPA